VAFFACLWCWFHSPTQLGLSFCFFCYLCGDFAPFWIWCLLYALCRGRTLPAVSQHNLGQLFLFFVWCRMWILTLFFFSPTQLGGFLLALVPSLAASSFFLFLLLVAQHKPYPQGDGSKLRLENLGLVQESAHGGLILFVVVLLVPLFLAWLSAYYLYYDSWAVFFRFLGWVASFVSFFSCNG